jgi:hypothetical protein
MPRPYPAPVATDVLAALDRQEAHLRTLRAELKVDYFGNEGRIKGTVAVLADRQGTFRLDTVSPLGTSLSTTVSDGSSLWILDARSDRFYAGPATACTVASIIGVPLPVRQLVAVLFGVVPRINPASTGAPGVTQAATLWWDAERGREQLHIVGENGLAQTLELTRVGARWRVERSELRNAQGRPLHRMTLEDFQWVESAQGELPTRVELDRPEGAQGPSNVRIRLISRQVNGAVESDAFSLPVPAGMVPTPLRCGGGAGRGALR